MAEEVVVVEEVPVVLALGPGPARDPLAREADRATAEEIAAEIATNPGAPLGPKAAANRRRRNATKATNHPADPDHEMAKGLPVLHRPQKENPDRDPSPDPGLDLRLRVKRADFKAIGQLWRGETELFPVSFLSFLKIPPCPLTLLLYVY